MESANYKKEYLLSLSYQHAYHAGNLADVHKHLWLMATLDYLMKKEKPFFWLDTHGGRGLYDLQGGEARKTQEADTGILRLLPLLASEDIPLWQRYLKHIRHCNPSSQPLVPHYYPGSALLAASLIRPEDRLAVCEWHPKEVRHLRHAMQPYSHTTIFHAQMEKTWSALLPPAQRRGGVFCDPSYEIKTEYETIPEQLIRMAHKWANGIYLLWYPLLPARRHEQLKTILKQAFADIYMDEWIFASTSGKEHRMYGSGIIILNPPYTVPELMQQMKILLQQKGILS